MIFNCKLRSQFHIVILVVFSIILIMVNVIAMDDESSTSGEPVNSTSTTDDMTTTTISDEGTTIGNLTTDAEEYVTLEQSSKEVDARRRSVRSSYEDRPNRLIWIERTLRALRRLLEYADGKAEQFNLDGMLGIRIAQGQLRVLLRRVGDTMPINLQDEIYDLTKLAGKVIDRAVPFIAASTPSYYKQMGIVLSDGFFEHDYDMRLTNASLVYPDVKIKNKFSEVGSDDCLSQLQGTGDYDGRPCSISDECWDLMTTPYYNDYPLTHQVLYFLIGESMKCDNGMEAMRERFCRLKGRCLTVAEQQEVLCANVVNGMKRLEERNFPGNTQDLFLEQAALCGIYGFRDVCIVRWLNLMLSWQQASGCYVRTDMHLHRQKRYDVLIDDDCSAHKTSVAAGALGVCTRFYVEIPAEANEYSAE